MIRFVTALAALMLTSAAAEAHYVWLERTGAEVKAYFGEWESDLREQGIRLDRFKSLTAFGADRKAALAVERGESHFAVKGAPAGDVRIVETGLAPADDKAKGGKTKTLFQAKAGRSETVGALDLELVPTVADGNDFILMLRGKPLAKADVHIFGPPKWGKELRTDEHGKVRLPTPWAGQYVAEVIHFEERAGGSGADVYNRIRHVSTLSFAVEQGIPWK
jgi:hypothetical protein